MNKKIVMFLCAVIIAVLGTTVFAACLHNNDEHVCVFGEWVTVTASNCTQTGLRERYCTYDGCDKKETQVIEIDPTAHSFEPVEGKEANCTEDGSVAYNHCTRCNKNFNDNNEELSPSDIVIEKSHTGFNDETLYCSACEKYIIKTAEQLKKFRDSVNNGKNYSGELIELEADIDLSNEDWTPIAAVTRKETDDSKFFKGTFDGKNHTISNVSSTNNTDNACVGLFGVTANAVIKNLNVQGVFTNNIDTVSALIGCDLSAKGEKTVISDCSINAVISGNCIGGILGRAYGAGETQIERCQTNGTFTATANGKAGGIVCINNTNKDLTVILNCVNNAAVSGGVAGTAGIVGLANNNLKIEKCTNTGNIGTDGNADKYAAGILGYLQGGINVTVKECENSGKICGVDAGGIFGSHGSNQEIELTDCTNSGSVNGKFAGGIACSASGQILNCVNTGTVTGSAEAEDGTAGGIVAHVSGDTDITVRGCSGGTAEITARYAGRLIGTVHNGLSVAYLAIDDTNGDGYENGLGTVGCVGAYTAYSTMVVTEGTLQGKIVSFGQAQGWIVINEPAKWLGYDETDQKTTWHFTYNSGDFEKTTGTPIPLQPK